MAHKSNNSENMFGQQMSDEVKKLRENQVQDMSSYTNLQDLLKTKELSKDEYDYYVDQLETLKPRQKLTYEDWKTFKQAPYDWVVKNMDPEGFAKKQADIVMNNGQRSGKDKFLNKGWSTLIDLAEGEVIGAGVGKLAKLLKKVPVKKLIKKFPKAQLNLSRTAPSTNFQAKKLLVQEADKLDDMAKAIDNMPINSNRQIKNKLKSQKKLLKKESKLQDIAADISKKPLTTEQYAKQMSELAKNSTDPVVINKSKQLDKALDAKNTLRREVHANIDYRNANGVPSIQERLNRARVEAGKKLTNNYNLENMKASNDITSLFEARVNDLAKKAKAGSMLSHDSANLYKQGNSKLDIDYDLALKDETLSSKINEWNNSLQKQIDDLRKAQTYESNMIADSLANQKVEDGESLKRWLTDNRSNTELRDYLNRN